MELHYAFGNFHVMSNLRFPIPYHLVLNFNFLTVNHNSRCRNFVSRKPMYIPLVSLILQHHWSVLLLATVVDGSQWFLTSFAPFSFWETFIKINSCTLAITYTARCTYIFTENGHFSLYTNLWSFSGDSYHVWWRLFLAYETCSFLNCIFLSHFEWAFLIHVW